MTDGSLARSGVQLYSLRDEGDGLLGMIPKLGAMGYEGVELFGGQLTGLDPAEVLAAAGMTVSSAHVGVGPDGTMDEAELDRLQAVGVDTVISPMIPELPDATLVGMEDDDLTERSAEMIAAGTVRPAERSTRRPPKNRVIPKGSVSDLVADQRR